MLNQHGERVPATGVVRWVAALTAETPAQWMVSGLRSASLSDSEVVVLEPVVLLCRGGLSACSRGHIYQRPVSLRQGKHKEMLETFGDRLLDFFVEQQAPLVTDLVKLKEDYRC